MAQSRLPFPEFQIVPSDAIVEPDIWLRRIVFVEKPELPLKIIRRITFRRGLNIVSTETRTDEDTKPVGHSVGKSLLVRIIRYSLGEDRFCTASLRSAITAKFERGYVFALVRVKGEDWSVARPIGLDTGYGDSWCVRTKRLKELLQETGRLKYRDFVDALDAATASCYADIDLPRAARKANWRDLLGWLSRDQDCHFDHHADWRTPEAQAGPRALTREDAYLVMRMALGLLGPEEIGLMEKHRRLLDSKMEDEAKAKQYDAFVAQAEQRLRQALEELKDQPSGEVFGSAFVNIADRKIGSLGKLLDDPDVFNHQELSDLRDTLDQSLRREGSLQNKFDDLIRKEQVTQIELNNARTQTAPTLLETLGALRWKCSYFQTKDAAHDAGCPGKTMVEQGIADPWVKHRIAELEAELAAIESAMAATRTDFDTARQESSEQRRSLAQRTADVVRVRGDIARQAGLWDARRNEAERYCSAWRDLEMIENRRASAQKKIDASTDTLKAARSRFETLKGNLSNHYDAVLKRIISPQAEGTIEVDGDGMRPKSNDAVADSGTTLREYADVLGFDLSCLAASVCGVGHLPRFWIHDSPRQADSEEQLYHSILRFLAELEAAYPPGRRPSFQYILTTTSAPAPEVNRAPFLRLRLHARTESGKLLKRDFGK